MFDRKPLWWQSAVFYQIYPRSFADSDGDGLGDIKGIISKLDYLAELGVDALWLSPIYDSPQDDNGYDISDYYGIYPPFGDMADVDELITRAHAAGMGVVLDLAVNHTSDEHPWFIESKDATSDKADWYIWRPARPGRTPGTPGAEPFNHGSVFGGSAWTFDPKRGEYYLHIFSRKQPDLNWDNPAVRHAVYQMMNWWVDRGVDGFRLDVINMISKPEPRDGQVGEGSEYAYDVSPVNGPRIHEYLRELHREVFEGRTLVAIGEMPGTTPEQGSAYTDPAAGEVDMIFTFEHVDLDTQPGGTKWRIKPLWLPDLKRTLAAWQDGLADVGWNSLYFENHDQPRVVSRWGDDSPEFRVMCAKTIGTVLHLHKGTPFVYQGEELGMTNAGFESIGQYADLESINAFTESQRLGVDPELMLYALALKSRDNARTPMQWDSSPNGGFSSVAPWLAANQNYREINAAAQRFDPTSVLAHYKALIALRHNHEIVRFGRFELLAAEDPALYAFTRVLADETWLVLANWSSIPLLLPDGLPDLSGAELVLGTHAGVLGSELAPWESRVLRLRQG